MRQIFLFFVVVNITTGLFAQTEFFYKENGDKLFFNIRKDKLIIKTQSVEDAKALCRQEFLLSAHDVKHVGQWVFADIDSSRTRLEDLTQIRGVVDATYGLEYVGRSQTSVYATFG